VKLACRHIQEERPQSAIPYLEAVLQDDPLDETALRQLLKALLVTGKRVEALRRYQGFQVRLREELGASRSLPPIGLFQRVCTGPRRWHHLSTGFFTGSARQTFRPTYRPHFPRLLAEQT
jgi:hypothetical protein